MRPRVADRNSLEATIAQLEATLDATHDGIIVVDLNRRVVLYNRQYLKMFHLTAEQVERGGADGIIEAITPQLENVEMLKATSAAIWSDPESEVLDVLHFKDGRVFERYLAPHRIGTKTVGQVASIRDVSGALRTERALGQQRAFLEQAQSVAHIGSWSAEVGGDRRLFWSAEAHRIFDVSPEAFGGTSAEFFSRVHDDDRDAVRAAADAAIARGTRYDIEHRIVRPDGSIRWLHESADVARDERGRAVRMIGTVQDVTERRLLEDQLRQSQKMEAIGRLAGGIAHDLNNALTAIAGYAELALGLLPDTHLARADVEEIRRGAERAGSVTRQLLAFSRKQILEPRIFDLNDTIAATAQMLSRLLGANIGVRTHLPAGLPRILGDPGQVEQAVINLAVNARDAMPNGGQLTLSTSIEEVDEAFARVNVPMTPGPYVALRVTDTGHGMSPDTQARIFEPFFTTKNVGKGTGLGLSMVYGTLKQIGGFIFVDSAVDQGTTFRLYFPPVADNKPRRAAPPAVEPSAGRRAETLLVVEDEPSVRGLVASTLRNDGYQLLLAASAEEALVAADGHVGRLDLLLTDAIMPGKSGIELASALALRRPGLHVIIMSGYTAETLTGLDERVELLQKPFTPRELRRRVREALDHGREVQQ
jgi:two-component system, cell cycle sensor histidine kinase and response regulator CckA